MGAGVGEGGARALAVPVREAAGEGATKPPRLAVSAGCAKAAKPSCGGSWQAEAGAPGLAHGTRYRPSWMAGGATAPLLWQVVRSEKVSA